MHSKKQERASITRESILFKGTRQYKATLGLAAYKSASQLLQGLDMLTMPCCSKRNRKVQEPSPLKFPKTQNPKTQTSQRRGQGHAEGLQILRRSWSRFRGALGGSGFRVRGGVRGFRDSNRGFGKLIRGLGFRARGV